MAGIEDHCPKCNKLVAAPVPKDPSTAAAILRQDSPPAAANSDAPEEIFPGLRTSLLDDFLSGAATTDAVPDTAPKPQKKSRGTQPWAEVTPELVVTSEPPKVVPEPADSPLARDPGPVDVARLFDQPLADSWNDPPDESLPDIGMGDALASYLSAPPSSVSRPVTPSLGFGLLHVPESPQNDRRKKRTRFMVAGVLLFLLVDAGFAFWFFRHRIQAWWTHGDTVNVKSVTPHPQNGKTAPAPEKNDPPPAKEPSAVPPAVVMPKPPEPAVVITPPEIRTDPEKVPAPEVVPVQPVPPPPVVIPIVSNPVKLPEAIMTPPPVITKLEIEPPPAPPPAPVIIDIAPPSDPPVATPPPVVERVEAAPARTALDSLKAFLAAPGISDRLRWCQKPETVRPLMEKHYTSHPDGPVKFGKIDLVASYPSKDGVPPYSMFELSGGSLKNTILALVEEKPKNEFRVDWEAFVEFKDGLLWEFMGKPDSRPQKFRVIMRRTHYFDKDVPDVGNKDGFELTQPGSEALAHVFVARSSPISRQLAQRLGWDGKVPATLELVWRVDGSRRWVEIQAVPSFGWRG